MVQWTILVSAGLLAAAVGSGRVPPIGEPITVEGRIDQIDDEGPSGPSGMWMRVGYDRAVLVRGGGRLGDFVVGERVRAEGTRGEDHVHVARDGRIRRYSVVLATEPIVRLQGAGIPMWIPATLAGLLAVFLVLALVLGRLQARPRPRRSGAAVADVDAAWSALDPGDLPTDPIDALAELARRADDEDQT